ncbi:MAG: class II aldolase/adducin family protein [Polyangiaceae bacterium]|nr:class II aldolase/adducin family protein [Polyangiaceae bacterium]
MPTPADEAPLRLALCQAARLLYDRGHNAPGDGNLSLRLADGRLLCTPSGVHKGRLEPSALVALDARGEPLDAAQRPSSELRMHLAIYRARPDVHAIVHAHSPHAVALTIAGVLGAVPTVPYASPTTDDVAGAVLPYARAHNAFLLERHGPVALGASLDEALMRLEVVEHTAKIWLLARLAGPADPIAPAELARLRSLAPPVRPPRGEG